MENYRLSKEAKADLIRIHQYGVLKFGEARADKYFDTFFEYFEIIAKNPFLYPSVDYIQKGYRRCACGTDSIYYRIQEEIVEIMAIIGRQEIGGKVALILVYFISNLLTPQFIIFNIRTKYDCFQYA